MALIYKFLNENVEASVYSIQSLYVASNGECSITTHHPYKINFQFTTKVVLLDNKLVPKTNPQHIPLFVNICPGFYTYYLVGNLNNYGLTSCQVNYIFEV